jgi:DNA replication protein DnaC
MSTVRPSNSRCVAIPEVRYCPGGDRRRIRNTVVVSSLIIVKCSQTSKKDQRNQPKCSNRRASLENRLQEAGFEEECTLERFDWSAKITIDKARLMELFNLQFIERHENVIFCGPVGVGKSFWAQALGHSACRAGHRVLFIRSDGLLKNLARSRADNSFDRELRSFLSPDLLIVDDFGLKKLSSQATSDFYDLLIERHTRSSTILTSDRGIDEWMAVFDDPMLGQSALDRFCHRLTSSLSTASRTANEPLREQSSVRNRAERRQPEL